ncbi:peptidase M23B [Candidatus Moduliflexus flocculans]|uniref:Peptidase M23B n=1 Tax=Candidatus Moduliflexus flocculans TaxID=1499966 RepID=A0A0S6W1C4_9BACT|nr:peptidase M23B [Candidatus Moduliflexus flocculans]
MLSCLLLLTACHSATSSLEETETCVGYPDAQTSAYLLPYETGASYRVFQGNCAPPKAPWTHYAKARYAYDVEMPIGAKIVAARAGTVVFIREQFTDRQHAQEQGNALVVLHDDNTVALYGHLTQNGALAELGQRVEQGETIALSGNSGQSGNVPHLHFQVNACPDFDACESVPVTFRNARPNPGRLIQGERYTAE